MTGNILLLIALCLGALAALLGLFDAWLRVDQQRAVREWFETSWVRAADTDPLRFALQPLRFLSMLMDRIFGATLSRQAFKRAFLMNALFMISLLSIAGIQSQVKRSSAAMPWNFYATSITLTKNALTNSTSVLNDPSVRTNEVLTTVRGRMESLAKHDTATWRAVYTFFFFGSVVCIGAFLGAISVTLTRQHLRELLEARSMITLFAGLALNAFLVWLLASFFLILLCFVAVPALWPSAPLILYLGRLSIYWTMMGLTVIGMLMWKFATLWFRVVATGAMLPSVFLLITLACSIVVFPARQAVLDFVRAFLLRIVESKRDPFGFLARLVGTAAFIAGAVLKICGK